MNKLSLGLCVLLLAGPAAAQAPADGRQAAPKQGFLGRLLAAPFERERQLKELAAEREQLEAYAAEPGRTAAELAQAQTLYDMNWKKTEALQAQVEAARARSRAFMDAPMGANRMDSPMGANPGHAVYGAEQCTGPIVAGVCHGGVIGQPKARCHGEMLAGKCTGPMF